MTLKRILGSMVLAAPLALAGPVWAQSAGGIGNAPESMTPSVGGSGTTAGEHAAGFQTGPGLQPPMAAPGPRTTARPQPRANVPPPAPIPETGSVRGPARDHAAKSAAPTSTRGAMPDTTGPNGINPNGNGALPPAGTPR